MRNLSHVFIITLISSAYLLSRASAQCVLGEFECIASKTCIPEENVCNGISDCLNRTDEVESICSKISCPSYTFRCAYGACIDATKVCNGQRDCLDGSDELITNCKEEEENENVGCPIDQFRCRSGECIDVSQVCDGHVHCSDESDETESVCLKIPCPDYAFRCRYGACVTRAACCDGIKLCADGSDEDELLCGKYYEVMLVKANRTGKVLQGSCKLPKRDDIRYINPIFEEEYHPGAFINDGELVEVVCKGGTAMNVSANFDRSNLCVNSRWDRPWVFFPECQTICSGADVTGRTIKANCELNGKIIRCDQQHKVGTIAYIRCGPFYDLPKDVPYVSQTLTCLPSGSWDKVALRCLPRCGRITQGASAYVINGQVAKNVAQVPWVAAIYKNDFLICSGTIITEKLIVSAAHCFFREQPNSLSESVILEDLSLFKVGVGKYYRDINAYETFQSQILNISEVISVPGYDGFMGFFSADFIVAVVQDYIIFRPHVVAICIDVNNLLLEDTEVQAGLVGMVAGWGFTTAGGNASDVLKIAKLPTVDYGKCKKESPQNYKQFVTPDKFCAGNIGGGDAVCQGDSGAGLAFPQQSEDDELFYLRGIVSNSRQNEKGCDSSFYTMFTNIHHYMHLIKSAMRRFPSS